MFERADLPPAEQKRYPAEDSETAVKEPPRDRDFAYMTGNESERDHPSTGNKTEGDHPLIAEGVAIRADEGNSYDQMSERQPVSPVCQEWKVLVCTG